MDYTIKNLREVKDAAAEAGVSDSLEARFAHEELDSERSGVSYQVVKAGQRQPFAHKHGEMEEIYVVLSGTGRVKLDDEIEDVGPLDAVRIAPAVTRAFEAGDDDLVLLAFSPRAQGDAEIVQDFPWE
ncbi:MAG TPA: cupin domain-containing protein [Solirubrobacterales bacterium]|nr:cupin domain-containing protein [Solirubrobacterales bacterium]